MSMVFGEVFQCTLIPVDACFSKQTRSTLSCLSLIWAPFCVIQSSSEIIVAIGLEVVLLSLLMFDITFSSLRCLSSLGLFEIVFVAV